MVKRLDSDLLLFFKTKKLCTSTFTVQFLFGRKEKEEKKEKKISIHQRFVLQASIKVLGCFKTC